MYWNCNCFMFRPGSFKNFDIRYSFYSLVKTEVWIPNSSLEDGPCMRPPWVQPKSPTQNIQKIVKKKHTERPSCFPSQPQWILVVSELGLPSKMQEVVLIEYWRIILVNHFLSFYWPRKNLSSEISVFVTFELDLLSTCRTQWAGPSNQPAGCLIPTWPWATHVCLSVCLHMLCNAERCSSICSDLDPVPLG